MSLPRLIAAAEALEDPDLARWLRFAAQRLRHGETAAEVLALDGPAALAERDRHLRAAARQICPDATPWRAAAELEHQIKYLKQHPSVLDRYPDLPEGQRDIAAALLCADIPTSQRRLYDALTGAR